MSDFKTIMMQDIATFASDDEFGELATYTSPQGVVTHNVGVVIALQNFVNEFDNYAGFGASIAISKSNLDQVEPHGKLATADGNVYTINQIYSEDDAFVNVSAATDLRISPQGMR